MLKVADFQCILGLYSCSHALYVPYRVNHLLAEEAIKHFLKLNKTILPKHMYHQYVLIIFEFCRQLKRAARTDDPLNGLCRSSLEAMMEYMRLETRLKLRLKI